MEILVKAGLRVPLLPGYVDDGRQGGTTLRRGMRFDSMKGEVVFDPEQKVIDDREDEPNNVRMKK